MRISQILLFTFLSILKIIHFNVGVDPSNISLILWGRHRNLYSNRSYSVCLKKKIRICDCDVCPLCMSVPPCMSILPSYFSLPLPCVRFTWLFPSPPCMSVPPYFPSQIWLTIHSSEWNKVSYICLPQGLASKPAIGRLKRLVYFNCFNCFNINIAVNVFKKYKI